MEDYKERYKKLSKYNIEELYQKLNIYLINNNRLEDTKIIDKLFINILDINDNGKVFSHLKKFIRTLDVDEYLKIYNIVCSYVSYLYENIDNCSIQNNNTYIFNNNVSMFEDYLFASFVISIVDLSRFSYIKSYNKKIRMKDLNLKLNNLYKDIYYKNLIDNRKNNCKNYYWRFDGNLFNFSRLAYMYHLDKHMFNSVMDINNNFLVELFFDGYTIDEIIVMDKKIYNCFKNRKYLLPEEGIIIKDVNYNGVGDIIIREKIINNKLWILIYYESAGNIYPLFINLVDKYTLFVNKNYTRILEIILQFYCIEPTIDPLTASEIYPGQYLTYNGNSPILKSNINLIYKIENNYKINIRKGIYTHTRDKVPSNNPKIEKTIKLLPHKRKLIKGHHPSQEALEYAKKYHLNLEEGETIVREHTKKIKINSSQI
ncbi:hypothetical protein [Clostridium massiliamazoniense]|uniref:hypothetical protein n=1 Tax=Clostridium massiliamazoniense TaxID=1347366 RepID=UPI0006D78F6B|nr:hypothetical protein [Clostridium massiliamazoniense]